MPSQEQCRAKLLASFEKGAQGKAVSARAKSWLETFCDDWLPNPPNADGKSVADIWDAQHGEPPANGRKFKGQFQRIGKIAADKCDANGEDEITESDVQAATREVTQASSCPFCPDT